MLTLEENDAALVLSFLNKDLSNVEVLFFKTKYT